MPTGEPVEQAHFTDNSAARQLASRHGVGKIRHLSGEILWVQDLVVNKKLTLAQIPTMWNDSEIGAKPLARNRLLVLLNQIEAIDVETREMIGQEEFEVKVERQQGQQSLKRVAKMIFRMGTRMALSHRFQLEQMQLLLMRHLHVLQVKQLLRVLEACGYG
eukprot:s875_g22.t1